MRKILVSAVSTGLALAGCLMFAPSAAKADIWTVNATFSDPENTLTNTMTGTINVTWGAPTATSYNLNVTGNDTQYDTDFTDSNSFITVNGFDASHMFVYQPGTGDFFEISWSPALTHASSTSPLTAGIVCANGPCTVLDSGTITSTAVPEAASTELLGAEGVALGLGFGLFALLRRRRLLND